MNDHDLLISTVLSPTAGAVQREEAFCVLVERFQDMAFGYALALLGDPALAEDAAQEAFIEAYRSLEDLKDRHAFPGWLRQIVHSKCHRRLRRRERLDQPLDDLPELASEQPGPPAEVERQELRSALRAGTRALPEAQRTAALLYYIDGYSQSEVAAFLGETTNAVKKQIQHARSNLQERMMEIVKEDLSGQRPSRSSRFLESVKSFLSLKAAADDSQVSMVEMMLLDGMEIDAQDEAGRTLLHLAVENNNLELVEFLLAHNAQTDRVSHAGKTPLQEALERGYAEIADVLRER
jgi:RNA polymerase sigma factor (sigma-70 family)